VVDDGSTDDIAEVARATGARDLRVITQAEQGTPRLATPASRPRGGNMSPFSMPTMWLPDKLERQLAEIQRDPGIRALRTGAARVDDQLSLLWLEPCRRSHRRGAFAALAGRGPSPRHTAGPALEDGRRRANGRDLLPPLRDDLDDLAARRQQSGSRSRSARAPAGRTRRRTSDGACWPRRSSARMSSSTIAAWRVPERLTPYSLRRTFASLLVALGEPPTYVTGPARA
jgi:hypothetical protein